MKRERILTIFKTKVYLSFCCSEEYEKKTLMILNNFICGNDIIVKKSMYITMDNRTIEIKMEDNCFEFEDFLETDIYPIFYSVVYELAREDGGIGIHSVAVEKEGKVILIYGDFGVGKSTLALSFAERGWDIISTDQTVIKKINNQLQIEAGSKYMKYNGEYMLFKGLSHKSSTIHMIIGIKGLARNGKVDICKNNRSLSRVLWQHCVWPWNTLICGYSLTNDFRKKGNLESVKSVLNNVKIPLYYVRGDVDGVRDALIALDLCL